jgi:hypothetical protein
MKHRLREAIEGIRQGLHEALTGQVLPLSAMWDGIDLIESPTVQVDVGNDEIEDEIAQNKQTQQTDNDSAS